MPPLRGLSFATIRIEARPIDSYHVRCSLYHSWLGLSGNGSRETSDSELSRTNLRSVPRLRKFLTGRGIGQLQDHTE